MKTTTIIRMTLGMTLVALCEVAHAAPAGEPIYSASFQWASKTPTLSNQAEPAARNKSLRIVISKNEKPGFTDSKIVARILDGDVIQAVCRVESLEITPQDGKAASLDLSCKSVAFGALAAPATVFFHNAENGQKVSVLRFGTWVQGYEQANLSVELDHSARLIKEMAPEPLQLARSR